jgi:hypothetical protein
MSTFRVHGAVRSGASRATKVLRIFVDRLHNDRLLGCYCDRCPEGMRSGGVGEHAYGRPPDPSARARAREHHAELKAERECRRTRWALENAWDPACDLGGTLAMAYLDGHHLDTPLCVSGRVLRFRHENYSAHGHGDA